MTSDQATPNLTAQKLPMAASSQPRTDDSSDETIPGTLGAHLESFLQSNKSFRGPYASSSERENLPKAAATQENVRRLRLPYRLLYPRCLPPFTYLIGDRSELESIEKILLPHTSQTLQSEQSRNDSKTFVLYGAGGSGKTELALKFTKDHCADFDAVFFLIADTETRLNDQFCQIAIGLGLEAEGAIHSPESCKAAVIAWLEDPVRWVERSNTGIQTSRSIAGDDHPANWLLVFDNVENPSVLSTFRPKAGKGSVLITSRDPTAASEELCATASAEIEGLPEEDAVELLELWTCNYRSYEDDNAKIVERQNAWHIPAEELVKKLHGLPLAINQIRGIILKENCDARSCLEAYERAKNFYATERPHPGRHSYEDNLATLLALDVLEDSAKALVSVIVLMDSGSTDEELLSVGLTLKYKMPHYPSSALELAVARAQLYSYSIISRQKILEPDGTVYNCSIHRLVQEVVLWEIAADNTISQAFQQVLASVEALWPWLGRDCVTGSAEKVDRWAMCAKLVPHIEQLATVYSEYFRGDKHQDFDITLAELLSEAGW